MSTRQKFKVGDRVKVINPGSAWVGEQGVVAYVSSSYHEGYYYEVMLPDRWRAAFRDTELGRVVPDIAIRVLNKLMNESREITVGSKVRVISGALKGHTGRVVERFSGPVAGLNFRVQFKDAKMGEFDVWYPYLMLKPEEDTVDRAIRMVMGESLTTRRFKIGQRVTINQGRYEGLSGIVEEYYQHVKTPTWACKVSFNPKLRLTQKGMLYTALFPEDWCEPYDVGLSALMRVMYEP